MSSNRLFVPEIYKDIHKKLKEESNNGIVETHQLQIILGRCFHCPKELRSGIVRGLESRDLIIVLDKFKVQIK